MSVHLTAEILHYPVIEANNRTSAREHAARRCSLAQLVMAAHREPRGRF
jgi:hypothetical protein